MRGSPVAPTASGPRRVVHREKSQAACVRRCESVAVPALRMAFALYGAAMRRPLPDPRTFKRRAATYVWPRRVLCPPIQTAVSVQHERVCFGSPPTPAASGDVVLLAVI